MYKTKGIYMEKDCRYICFDFSDFECKHYPSIVRINKKVSIEILKEIDQSIQNEMNEYIDREEYWDTDEYIVDKIMQEFAAKYEFTYEFVEMDYLVDCN